MRYLTSVKPEIMWSFLFDWAANAEKFPGLCTPDDSYHGITYVDKFGKGAYITKATVQLMRDLGSIQAIQDLRMTSIMNWDRNIFPTAADQ